MSYDSYYKEDFSGPIAFVLGAEGEGVSDEVADRCDKKISTLNYEMHFPTKKY